MQNLSSLRLARRTAIALYAALLLSFVGGVPAAHAQTVIVDNSDSGFSILSGSWSTGSYGSPYGTDYNWAATTSSSSPTATAEWRPVLAAAGEYEVAVHFVAGANRATDAPFTIDYAGGTTTIEVNQQAHDSTWVPLGTFAFDAGTGGAVTLSNDAGPTVVIADAVRFRSAEGLVYCDNPLIRIGGAMFPDAEDFSLRLDRIAPALLADTGGLFSSSVAVLTTGVTVRFRTDSPTVRANFNHLSYVVTENTGYVVYQDGVYDKLVNELEVVDITSQQPGAAVTYEIVCPSYDEVTLAELRLEPGATLLPLPDDRRPHYFALGDSITHGAQLDADTKADSTASYPWVLAAMKGWELYNLGVGASRVTPAFGEMLAGQQVDIITILWGLNDKGIDNDLALYVSKYETLLDNLRTTQPVTPIYCITLTVCAAEDSAKDGYTLDDYRTALATLVAARQAAGDCNLHLIRGEELTTIDDLSDGAHFSVAGAANFATELANVIGPPWGDLDANGVWNAADWLLLADCISGPEICAPAGACEEADRDCDGDVDLHEFAAFQQLCGS